MEIFIHIPYVKQSDNKSVLRAAGSDLRECLAFVKNDKPIFLSVLVILALFNLVLSAAMVVGIPIMVVQVLEMSDTALGITEAAMGLGGLAGGIIAGTAAQKMKLKNGWITLVLCSLAALFMGISLLEFIPPLVGYIIITAGSFGAMCAATMFSVSLFTAVQQQTPPHLLGKIMAVITAISSCSQPLGQAVYGVLFDTLSNMPYTVMIGSAAASMAVALGSKRIFERLDK